MSETATPRDDAPTPEVSVIVCTHNPKPHLLRAALASIAAQDLPRDRFEFILVDNASSPPVDVEAMSPDPTLEIRIVREARPGLTVARLAAIDVARGSLFVFVDDDNELAPDYVRHALRIATDHPEIGAFGGAAEGVFEHPVPMWKQPLLGYLGVRDHGRDVITSTEPRWGEWDPIGAGMVTRRDVAIAFADFVRERELATGLGRRGKALMSGEDTLIARCANRLGYACSYQPDLRLKHHIEARRLEPGYLKRLLEGHGRSFVLLERVLGREVKPIRRRRAWQFLWSQFWKRVRGSRRTGYVIWHWDLGYVRESGKSDEHGTSQAAS